MTKNLRDLLPDYCSREDHPSLREASVQPLKLLHNREPEEDIVHALLPGDALEDHPLMDGVEIDSGTQTEQLTGRASREEYRGRPAERAVDPRIVSPGVYRRDKQITIRSGGGTATKGFREG